MNSDDRSCRESEFSREAESGLALIGRRFAEIAQQRLKANFPAICEADTRNDLRRAGVLHSGHFAFRRGYHTDQFYAFGELSRSPEGPAILELLARRIDTLLGDTDYSTIVTHGFEMSKVATELVRLSRRPVPPHQLHATGSDEINFMGARQELKGERVLLLLNVVHSGALLEELVRRLSEEGAALVKIVSIVDLGRYRGAFRSSLVSLVHDKVSAVTATECGQCAAGVRFEHVDLDWGIEGPSLQRPVTLSEIQNHLTDMFGSERKFWSLVMQAKAIYRHKLLGNVHVSPVVDVSRLIEVGPGQEWLMSRFAEILIPLAEQGPWTLVSVPRKDPSHALAEFAARQVRNFLVHSWPVVHSRHSRGFIDFESRDQGAPPPERALVLDAGAYRGVTLRGVFSSLRNWGVKELAACVVIDRTTKETRRGIESECGGRYFGMVRAPFKTFRTEDSDQCPFCWRVSARLRAQEESAHELVIRYLEPKSHWWPVDSAHDANPDVLFQGQLFSNSSVGLKEFQSLLYSIALQERTPGTQDETLLAHCIGQDDIHATQRTKVINALTANYLSRPRIQDSLTAIARNNVSPTLLEAACVSLARTKRFDWLDGSWFSGHTKLLSKGGPREGAPWMFMAYVLNEFRKHDGSGAKRLHRTLTDSVRRGAADPSAKEAIESLSEVLAHASF